MYIYIYIYMYIYTYVYISGGSRILKLGGPKWGQYWYVHNSYLQIVRTKKKEIFTYKHISYTTIH